jgi:hypothetical protein|tara:strand:- start:300 stop:722 length:423 start_codon:yes stop_codon:yes gene_type:complete
MIKYILRCENEHEFESWFSNSKEFEKLKKNNFLNCVKCQSLRIEKSIMSPRVLSGNKNETKEKENQKELRELKIELIKMRKFVEKNFKFVGDHFAKEVKNIYYDKKNNTNIYGTATPEELDDLEEEGIEFNSIPWVDKEN